MANDARTNDASVNGADSNAGDGSLGCPSGTPSGTITLTSAYTVQTSTLRNNFVSSGGDANDDCTNQSGGFDFGVDVAVSFTAPENATYIFTTQHSVPDNLDTVLYLRASCDSTADLVCNDDIIYGELPTSRVSLAMTAGQTVVVVADINASGQSGEIAISVRTAQ